MTSRLRQRLPGLRTLAIAVVLVTTLAACGATLPEATPTPAESLFDGGATFGTAVYQ